MSRPGLLARRALTGAVTGAITVVAAVALAGCGAGNTTTSRMDYAPADGLIATSGNIRALNVLVVASEGSSDGLVVMTLANKGTSGDRLTDIQSSSGSVELSGPTTIEAGQALTFGADTETTAVVRGLDVKPGEAVEVTLNFENAAPISLNTVVMPADGDYATLTPSASPTPTESETPAAGMPTAPSPTST